MASARRIVAIGGLYADPEPNRPLVDYVLKLAGVANPRLGFIPTASGDAPRSITKIEAVCAALDCRLSLLPMFDRTPDLEEFVADQDVLLIGGGNTKSQLAVWREWGLDSILRRAWERGQVLSGWSAGAICWFEHGLTDSWADRLRALNCLGFLPGSCSPHYDGESERRPAYHELIRQRDLPPGIGIEDSCAVQFDDQQIARVIGPAAKIGAWNVTRHEAETGPAVVEVPLVADRVEI
ncbi:MAG: peptidase E [Planctomycetes bacterium]|nr:peptidase E [Planctomycetota bacterium]